MKERLKRKLYASTKLISIFFETENEVEWSRRAHHYEMLFDDRRQKTIPFNTRPSKYGIAFISFCLFPSWRKLIFTRYFSFLLDIAG